MNRYVAGFMFNEAGTLVLLIRKNKPQWQAGKLNGVGGKVKQGESYYDAMVREFEEEAGIKYYEWDRFCTLQGAEPHIPGAVFEVAFFAAFSKRLHETQDMTDEPLVLVNSELPSTLEVIDNVRWLIPMAKEVRKNFKVYGVSESVGP